MAKTLKGANVTAQWYEDNYLGALFSWLEKFVIHTTETESWPGYSGGASSPNATYHPRLRQIRQHHSNNRSSRALRDPSSTVVRENRDKVFQLEIIAYSDYALARSVGGLWIGDLTKSHFDDIAAMIVQLHREEDLPLGSTVRWKEGQKTYVSGVRLSGPSFDAYRGILGHVHVSGNDHWDPGGLRYSQLDAAIDRLLGNTPTPEPELPEEDEMAKPYVSRYGATQWVLIGGMEAQVISVGTMGMLTKGKGALEIIDPPHPNDVIRAMLSLRDLRSTSLANKFWTKFVRRGGKDIAAIQELADAKTIGLELQAELDVIKEILNGMVDEPAPQMKPVAAATTEVGKTSANEEEPEVKDA